ncbi:MAG TPA: hypothetical protein VHM65_09430, partial [Candidatus Lustribacter sp.]|nr:hypothetical protein [Candidatus Lustribacter sp.]
LIGRFVHAVELATRERHGRGRLTRYGAGLAIPGEVRAEIAVLKGTAAHFVMLVDERLAVMALQRDAVADLVAAYRADPLGRLDPDLRADFAAAADDVARLRVVVDQVASLTDARAWNLHAQWSAGQWSTTAAPTTSAPTT